MQAYGLYGMLIYPMNIILDGKFDYFIMSDAIPLTFSALLFLSSIFRLTPHPEMLQEYKEYEIQI